MRTLQKLQVVKGIAHNMFSGYGNLTYIRLTLKEIKLAKQLFVLQI